VGAALRSDSRYRSTPVACVVYVAGVSLSLPQWHEASILNCYCVHCDGVCTQSLHYDNVLTKTGLRDNVVVRKFLSRIEADLLEQA